MWKVFIKTWWANPEPSTGEEIMHECEDYMDALEWLTDNAQHLTEYYPVEEVVFEAKPISRFHRLKDIPDYNPEDHVNMGQSAIIQQYINPHLKN
jgi:hypothetical protein